MPAAAYAAGTIFLRLLRRVPAAHRQAVTAIAFLRRAVEHFACNGMTVQRAHACSDYNEIRLVLLNAHERGVRPSEHASRHITACDVCRAYRRDIRALSKQLQALNPSLGLPLLAGAVKLVGSTSGKLALGAGAAPVIATTVVSS